MRPTARSFTRPGGKPGAPHLAPRPEHLDRLARQGAADRSWISPPLAPHGRHLIGRALAILALALAAIAAGLWMAGLLGVVLGSLP